MNIDDEQQLVRTYYREVESLALRLTGGRQAIVFDHQLRQREAGPHRVIVPTDAGEQLFEICLPCTEKLAEFSERIKSEPKCRALTIFASIGAAALWILPRFGGSGSGIPASTSGRRPDAVI